MRTRTLEPGLHGLRSIEAMPSIVGAGPQNVRNLLPVDFFVAPASDPTCQLDLRASDAPSQTGKDLQDFRDRAVQRLGSQTRRLLWRYVGIGGNDSDR
jgi:hypothetical protein